LIVKSRQKSSTVVEQHSYKAISKLWLTVLLGDWNNNYSIRLYSTYLHSYGSTKHLLHLFSSGLTATLHT